MENNETTAEQQAKLKAKLDEMKMKRAGKIPKDANVVGIGPEQQIPERPTLEEMNAAIKVVTDTIRTARLQPDQVWHLGAELQLLATNDMMMNGLNSMGMGVEKFIKERVVMKEEFAEKEEEVKNNEPISDESDKPKE